MIGFLRFVGMMNAAVWFGSAIFFTALVVPAFFSPEYVQLLTKPRSDIAANFMLSRYYDLQLWCSGIAMMHLVAECVYLGKPLSRFQLGLLAGLLCVSLIGNFWLQPRLLDLQKVRYSRSATPEQRSAAARAHGAWNGVGQFANFLSLAGVMVYLWQITGIATPQRPLALGKFRS